MSLTIHDLRVLLRDKMKIIDDLQAKLNEFRSELNEKEHMLREQGASVKKKDETTCLNKRKPKNMNNN